MAGLEPLISSENTLQTTPMRPEKVQAGVLAEVLAP
jgi:hypothetical protein